MKPATVSRRAVRAAVLERVRNLPAEEFGECELCGFMHNRPLERTRCPLCGAVLCLGEPACGCEDSVRGGEYNAADAVGAACANTGPRGRPHIRVHGGDLHGE